MVMAANFTLDEVFQQLNSGRKWTGSTITYAFPSSVAASLEFAFTFFAAGAGGAGLTGFSTAALWLKLVLTGVGGFDTAFCAS